MEEVKLTNNHFRDEIDFKQQKVDPTTVSDRRWLFAAPTYSKKYPMTAGCGMRKSTETGKWLIFLSPDKIKEWWFKVCDVQSENWIVRDSKCSTAMENKYSASDGKYVIVLYCDTLEAMEAKERLREIGVTWKIPFKPHIEGVYKYSVNGDKNISSLFC